MRKLREQKRFSQEYVAARLGVTQSAYNKMESGQVELTINRLYDICDVLQTSLFTVLGPAISDGKFCEHMFEEYCPLNSIVRAFNEDEVFRECLKKIYGFENKNVS